MPNFFKRLSEERKKKKERSSQSGSRAGSQSGSSRKASSDWRKASKDLGIFKDAEEQYNELKSTLEKDHKGKDYDLWWKKDGSTMISIGKPNPDNYQASEGETLGKVTFEKNKSGKVDVTNKKKWEELETYATDHSEEDDWKGVFDMRN